MDGRDDRIERIVRGVLARLAGTLESTAESANNTDHTNRKELQPTHWVLKETVITADALEGKLHGVGEVHVRSGAVVTPAAQDALRCAKARLVRAGSDASTIGTAECRLVVGVAACAAEPAAVVRLAEVHRGAIEHLARVGLVDVVREMAQQVVLGGSKGLLFTDTPAAGLCLANRSRGVRAVAANCAQGVETEAASVGANLLVIRPTGRSTWQQLQMTKSFLACNAACPSELAAALS
jgi:hypothetical protein